MNRMLLLSLPLIAAGCQTLGPTWSEVTGERYSRVVVDRYPTVIKRVDEQGGFTRFPTSIEPGKHRLVLQPRDAGRFIGATEMAFSLDAAPCRRYYVNAQFKNSIQPEWAPVIDYIEEIVGCKVDAAK